MLSLFSRTVVTGSQQFQSRSASATLLGFTSFLISTQSSLSYSSINHIFGRMAAGSVPTVLPTANHTGTVIFLHGLGDTGHGWCAGFKDIKHPNIKYIFPNAPSARVTLNFGMVMPSWFDIKSLDASGDEDEEGIKKSSDILTKLVEEEEKNGIPTDRIVIGGFSQGGAVAIYNALTHDKKYGGLILLSTWLALRSKFPQMVKGDKSSTPVLQGHGNADPVLNYSLGKMTGDFLKQIYPNFEFKTYIDMGHSSSEKEMKDVKEFLAKCLP